MVIMQIAFCIFVKLLINRIMDTKSYIEKAKALYAEKRNIFWILAGIAVLIVALILFSVISYTSLSSELDEAMLANEQLQLTNEQLQLTNEYRSLNESFMQYENQQMSDSIAEKYAQAKSKVEKLLQELNNEKVKSAKRIKELESEIATLKGILRHYVEQIDALGKENQALRNENKEIKKNNAAITSRLEEETMKNQDLSEKYALAQKLNVTDVSLNSLKKNGKNEKKITKAKQLEVVFTIPQNNSTPVGEKIIYLRIVNPEGDLLGAVGEFEFEDAQVQYTAKKTIEYAGEEIADVKIYWDVNSALNPGEYTVELFADNYRLTSKKFTFKK